MGAASPWILLGCLFVLLIVGMWKGGFGADKD